MTYIVYVAQPGLANRMRALAGYAVLARVTGVRLKVQWLLTPACDAPFDSLFQRTCLADLEFIAPDEVHFRSDQECSAVYETSHHFLEIHGKFAPSHVSDQAFRRMTAAVLQCLQPVPELQSRIDALAEQLDVAECIGVHVRMTDNLNLYSSWAAGGFDPARASRLSGFAALIGMAGERAEKVFLATDNAAVEQDLTRRFVNVTVVPKTFQMGEFSTHHQYANHTGAQRAVVKFWRRVRSRLGLGDGAKTDAIRRPTRGLSRTTPIGDALVDLYLLSRCRRVVGTYWSSFGEIAAYVGGISCSLMLGEHESPPFALIQPDTPGTGESAGASPTDTRPRA